MPGSSNFMSDEAIAAMGDFGEKIADLKGLTIGISRGMRNLGNKSNGPKASPRDALVKAVTARFIATALKFDPETVCNELYPNKPAVKSAFDNPGHYLKAITSPATTYTAGWAAELVETAPLGVLASLAPLSVYARLAARGPRVDVDAYGHLVIPRRAAPAAATPVFVGEGNPIPVRGPKLSSSVIAAHKASLISFFSGELAKRSAQSVEAVLRMILAEDIAAGLDGVLLGDADESDIEPAGLLAGLDAIPATGNGPAADLAALAAGLSPAPTDPVFIMSAASQINLLTLPGAAGLSIITTDALPDGRVILVDASDFCSATGDTGEISVTKDAAFIAADPAVAVVDEAGTRGQPTTSLFQQNLIAVRPIEDIGWLLRRPNRVAFMDGWNSD